MGNEQQGVKLLETFREKKEYGGKCETKARKISKESGS